MFCPDTLLVWSRSRAPGRRGAGSLFRIEVAGSNDELCRGLVEACAGLAIGSSKWMTEKSARAGHPGYPPASPPERVLTIWDVPILEPDWPERLEQRSLATGPVIAVFGFADRTTVTEAKAQGAVACLEVPYNVDDLLDVIDRTVRAMPQGSWPVPARREPPHVLPPRPRGRRTRRPSPRSGSSKARAGPAAYNTVNIRESPSLSRDERIVHEQAETGRLASSRSKTVGPGPGDPRAQGLDA